jgi:electron transfer flavoprotein beta subunit
MRAQVQVWDARTIAADAGSLGLKGSPTWVRKIFSPPPREGGPSFDAQESPTEAVEQCLDTLMADESFSTKFLKGWKA